MSEDLDFCSTWTNFNAKAAKNSHLNMKFILYLVLVMPVLSSSDKRTVVEIRISERTATKRLTAVDQLSRTKMLEENEVKIRGKLMEVGGDNDAEGRLHMLPSDCDDDEKSYARLPEDWVAVVHYTDNTGSSTGHGTTRDCASVVDRMKTALMFGASAIIILTMNPVFIKELDISQLFSKPVVLIDIAENITHMLQLISGKLKLRAKFVYNITLNNYDSQKFFTTVTLWGTCGRYNGRSYHEWDGVVCLGHHDTSKDLKVDTENFWNYFYTCIVFLMMMHYLRTRRGQNWEDPDYIEGHIRQLAYQALAVMKIKRYASDGSQDTCAICLENFFHKQRLRVLPCGHHFHTKCVDPWLVHNHTCPLCKLNVIEKLELEGN